LPSYDIFSPTLHDALPILRDIFVFCCYTGLAYADVEKLTREEITTGIDGEKWIWTSRQKTDSATRVPLLPPALEILDRYKDDPRSEEHTSELQSRENLVCR